MKFNEQLKADDKVTTAIAHSAVEDEMRTIGIVGDVDEEKCAEILYSLIVLQKSAKIIVPEDPEDPDTGVTQIVRPIEFIISTCGGSADEMFALYDVMRNVQKDCDIITRGLGKVMSAGVLLLAAGTKGKREIGKHCRVMIHSVIAGNAGSFHNLENEMEEVRNTQEQYIKALVGETNMTTRQLKKMLERKVNIYLTAQEAVELGIADIII